MFDFIGYLRRIMNQNPNETFNQATDSLEAIRNFLATGAISSGLAFVGVVTAVPGANQFTIPTLIGHGDTAFVNWNAFVFWDAGGAGAAPQGEQQAITGYVSATGIFTTGAFTAAVAVGDVMLIMHPEIAAILNLARVQQGTQATTAVLAVVGAAIESAVPFKVSGCLSLHNMQAGDTFLVTEDIRDQDDATYREYDRHNYNGVQVSPMVWFEEKVCQGWRIRIQRTAGGDRDVTYQFFTEVR
jgi:hypothetical protein